MSVNQSIGLVDGPMGAMGIQAGVSLEWCNLGIPPKISPIWTNERSESGIGLASCQAIP